MAVTRPRSAELTREIRSLRAPESPGREAGASIVGEIRSLVGLTPTERSIRTQSIVRQRERLAEERAGAQPAEASSRLAVTALARAGFISQGIDPALAQAQADELVSTLQRGEVESVTKTISGLIGRRGAGGRASLDQIGRALSETELTASRIRDDIQAKRRVAGTAFTDRERSEIDALTLRLNKLDDQGVALRALRAQTLGVGGETRGPISAQDLAPQPVEPEPPLGGLPGVDEPVGTDPRLSTEENEAIRAFEDELGL